MNQELKKNDKLAYLGGVSVRSHNDNWPKWPVYSNKLIDKFKYILDSRCWSVSSNYNGNRLENEKFANEFAKYNNTSYCVPTDHGSSAIIAVLKSLGIGEGDEVIVTGLTWVACPLSILEVGATPILVDVDPNTQCINPSEILNSITSNTKALFIVHLYNAMAEMDEIMKIAKLNNLYVIEDCAQAHGAEWNGKKAGSIGDAGVFSFHQGKPLASGEGGAVITSNSKLYEKLQQTIMNGRVIDPFPVFGHVRLQEKGEILGGNMALAEFQAAVLLDTLPMLNDMNRLRLENAQYLDTQLENIPGIIPIKPYKQNNLRSYYHYSIRYDHEIYTNLNVTYFCQLLEAELHTWVHTSYSPLNAHPLYAPHKEFKFKNRHEIDPKNFYLPFATQESKRTILFHHSVLLGSRKDMNDIINAFAKVHELYLLGERFLK